MITPTPTHNQPFTFDFHAACLPRTDSTQTLSATNDAHDERTGAGRWSVDSGIVEDDDGLPWDDREEGILLSVSLLRSTWFPRYPEPDGCHSFSIIHFTHWRRLIHRERSLLHQHLTKSPPKSSGSTLRQHPSGPRSHSNPPHSASHPPSPLLHSPPRPPGNQGNTIAGRTRPRESRGVIRGRRRGRSCTRLRGKRRWAQRGKIGSRAA